MGVYIYTNNKPKERFGYNHSYIVYERKKNKIRPFADLPTYIINYDRPSLTSI